MQNPLSLKSLNHVSIVCRSLHNSIDFYVNVLGFYPIRRPGSFGFDGAWLFNFGFGIHLLQSDNPDAMPPITSINPKANHISFQCESMENVEQRLKEMKIEHVKNKVVEAGIEVEQIFFHDPDGTMIEVCNCDALPIVPIRADSEAAVVSSPRAAQPTTPRMCRQLSGARLPSMENRQPITSLINLATI